jgi:GTP pyrophosphokinase
MRREGLPVQKLTTSPVMNDLAEAFNYNDVEALHAAIGGSHVSGKAVAQRLSRILKEGGSEERLPSTARRDRTRRSTRRTGVGVHVEGLDDVMVRLSRCCTPVPGDEIIGFVTRGRGVSVHRADCANAVSLAVGQGDRVIEVEWDNEPGGTFVVSIEVEALDRSRLLRDVSAALADHHVNILSCNTQTGADRISRMQFDFELGDPSHLDSVIRTIRTIDAVYDAYRLLPGGKSERESAT